MPYSYNPEPTPPELPDISKWDVLAALIGAIAGTVAAWYVGLI